MKSRIFGCSKFKRVAFEAADRILSEREESFLEKHRSVCPNCMRIEMQSATALNSLRSVTLEATPDPMFEERVLRRLRVSKSREGFRTWSPAIVGASIACIAIVSALQMVSVTSNTPAFRSHGEDAMRLKSRTDAPLLLLDRSSIDSKLSSGINQ